MKIFAGTALCILFLSISAVHIYWGLGGKWGAGAAIPIKPNSERTINPGLAACLLVASGLLVCALFSLVKMQVFSWYIPAWVSNYGLWFIAALFLLRAVGEFKYVGFFKKISTTNFGRNDTKYFSPLCALIAILAVVLQLSDTR